MSSFTVRVELIKAGRNDYEKLHLSMVSAGYKHEIRNETGRLFCLPEGEYIISRKNSSASQIRDEVISIADTVRKTAFVLVTRASERSWQLIEM